MKCIIEINRDKFPPGTLQARTDFAIVTGQEMFLKPTTFLDTTSGEYYCDIVGGVAYPTATNPGCIIIIGVQNEPEIKFRVIDAVEDKNIFILIKRVIDYREKYGFGKDSRLLPWWYGDQEKFQTLIVKASIALEKKLGESQGLYLKDTVDLREKNSFPLYIRQIYNTLENKRLDHSDNDILVGALQGFPYEDVEKGRTENFPVVGLLGGMVHSLQVEQPWLQSVVQGKAFNVAI